MVVVSYSGREINAKLVYYGTGLSGKTTNLEYIYSAIPATSRGKMVSMKTQNDRTLFFDLLPVDLGEISGFKTRFMLYTVPGQVFYNATRKLVLRGADAVVFVADSERGKMEENKESLQNLRDNLREYNVSLDNIPWVIQYNKRDLENVYSVEELNRELNPRGVPFFEAVAFKGPGVFETFRGVSRLLLDSLGKELKLGSKGGSAAAVEAVGPAPAKAGASASIEPVSTPVAARPVQAPPSAPAAQPFAASAAAAPSPPAPSATPEPSRTASEPPSWQRESELESSPHRGSPSLAQRFSTWWKSGAKSDAPPARIEDEDGDVDGDVPSKPEPLHLASVSTDTRSREAASHSAQVHAAAPARAQTEAPARPAPAPVPVQAAPAPVYAAPVVPAPAARVAAAQPSISESVFTATAGADRTVSVPLRLEGIRPGQKVRVTVILEVEAVEE